MVAMAAVAHRGNLDSNAQDRQLRVGLVALAGALVVALLLVTFYRVCGFTAIAGRRMTADGVEKVADRAELSAQRRSGFRVIVLSVACAALATALFVVAS
jgi:uncharacterized membrane protein YecN with MAPEG domain